MDRRINQFSAVKPGFCSALLLVSACSAAPLSETHPLIPQHWVSQIDLSKKQCTPIHSDFRNVGERFDESEGVILDARLGEYVFSRYLEGGQIAQTVELESDTSTGLLKAQLVGDSSRIVRFQVSCDAGWHVVSFTRAGNYLGEGVVEEQFEQISTFRLDRQARLVARVRMEGEFKSMYLFKSAGQSEGWYRFAPVKQDSNGGEGTAASLSNGYGFGSF